jgi:hypothetical protein
MNNTVLNFSGIAEIVVGHDSWSMRTRNEWLEKKVIRFVNGFPVEILEEDSKSFHYSASDRGMGFEGSCTQTKLKHDPLEWEAIVKSHKPKLVIHQCTRDNGENEDHQFRMNGKFISEKAQEELLKRVAEFDKK